MFNPLLSHHVLTALHEDRTRELGRRPAPLTDRAAAVRPRGDRPDMAALWRRLSVRSLAPARHRG